jgi:RHS repeat-associated protein
VYVTDANNGRIETFSEAGAYTSQSGSWGTGIGQYEYPGGIAYNPSGKLFIADTGNNRVQEWTTSFSEFQSTFGTHGSGSGQLSEPEGLAFNSSGELFIADAGNNRIQKWAPPGTPRNLAAPALQGELISGQTLTASTGTWSASPTPTYTYQWERCNSVGASCASISGATAATYTPGSADYEHTLRVAVKATNSGGSATSDSSTTALFLRPRKTELAYDAAGNIESIADANGNKTKYTYDADNEPTKTEEPNSTTTETGYDKAGQVTSQTDGLTHTTKYTRNLLEQVTEVIDPRERKTLKEYDRAGNLTKITDAEGRTTTITYTPANRTSEISYSDGHTHSVKYEYNGDGKLTHMTDGTGETTYAYDTLDRLTESKNGHGETIVYEYNTENNPVKITYPNSKSITRTYDKDGRLESVKDWSEHTTKFTYDQDSDLTKTTFPANEDKYTYNNADYETEVKMLKGTETLASLAYTRDSDNQIKTATSKDLPGEEKPEYTYDSNNRLTQGAGVNYEYNKANSPTKIGSGSYTYSTADELETGPSMTYTYNEDGQRTKTTPTTGTATTYGYDQAGNLTTIERGTEVNDSYTYDGNNLRASQTISGTTTYLAWDTAEELPLLLSDGTNSYIYGPSNQPIEQINNTTSAVLYLHHDQQGSTRLLTSSTGAKEAAFTYGPYGALMGSTGTATTPLGYDGQYTSSDTGLIYLRAREYDPATAQFLSIDPAVSITRIPYNYSGDNPMNFQDRRGFSEETFGEGPTCRPGLCLHFPSGEEYQRAGEAITEVGNEIAGTAESIWNTMAGDSGSERNPAQDKKLTEREVKELEEAGHHPHEFKPGGSKEDLYRDREGNIYVKPKGGAGPGEPTGINLKKWSCG